MKTLFSSIVNKEENKITTIANNSVFECAGFLILPFISTIVEINGIFSLAFLAAYDNDLS